MPEKPTFTPRNPLVISCNRNHSAAITLFLQRHGRAVVYGGILTYLTVWLLTVADIVIVIPGDLSLPRFLILSLLGVATTWAVLAYLISKNSFGQVLVVVGLLVGAALADRFLQVGGNPITVPFILLFWLGVAYLVVHRFFRKYQTAILVVYGVILSYYVFTFISVTDYGLERRASFASLLILPLPVFAGLWIFEQYRWLQTLRADKVNAELSLLRSQLNPHFFFNTLNNLYGLAVEKSDDTPDMILKLSDMMRYTIYEGASDKVPLAAEADYLENFIELHTIRHHRMVDISFVRKLDHSHEIAPLLLIIPLENAFKHGVEQQVDDAFIEMEMTTGPRKLWFSVRNNYVPDVSTSRGIGLDNLKRRLTLLYPGRHDLAITVSPTTYTVNLEIEFDALPDN